MWGPLKYVGYFIVVIAIISISASAEEIVSAERYINPALAKPGDSINVDISISLSFNNTVYPLGVKETVPLGWEIRKYNTSPANAICKIEQYTLECILPNVTNQAKISYELYIPDDTVYDVYLLSGEVLFNNKHKEIIGENAVMVSDSTDESPPIIQSVNVTPQPVEPGDQIYVKVTASDDVGILSVKANGVWLSKSGGDSWVGYLTAQSTGVLNVTVRDYSGKTTSESFNYEIVAPTANTTVTTAETPVNTTTTVTTTVETTTAETTTTVTTPVSTTVITTTATETPTETPVNTTVTTTTPTETATETTTVETTATATETTVTETATPRTPGFNSAIVVIVLLAVAYLIRRF